uniref:Cytochrome P450 n=1 Tax=Leersia perrieri TaxID=77586 RepID=A0A0D9XLI5_9ORYZ
MDTLYIILGAILAAAIAAVVIQFRGNNGGRRLPPGPPTVPLLGSVVLLTKMLTDVEPETLLRRLISQYGPIVSLRKGTHVSVFISDHRLAHVALVEGGAALSDRPSPPENFLLGETNNLITRGSYGATWRLLRRNLVSETLHPSRVRHVFAPARTWARHVLLARMRASPEKHDVMDTLRYVTFYLLVAMCFGERLDEATVRDVSATQHDILVHMSSFMGVFAYFPAITKHIFRRRLERVYSLRRRQRELFLPLINLRRKHKTNHVAGENTLENCYVDTLLDIKLPDERRALTDDEIIKLCSEFLNGGTDTTATGLEWIMAELIKNPTIQTKLHNEIKSKITTTNNDEVTEEDIQEMPYLRAVVMEGLRKHPPAHFVLPHRAAEDIAVGGYVIPKGATVNFMVAEMGRDEREWEKPMEFIPERFLAGGDGEGVDVTGSKGRIRMMPFGVGRRICAGLNIAMLHLEYFVANMVMEFEWKEVAGDEVDFTEKREFTTVMAKPLRARLVPRRG